MVCRIKTILANRSHVSCALGGPKVMTVMGIDCLNRCWVRVLWQKPTSHSPAYQVHHTCFFPLIGFVPLQLCAETVLPEKAPVYYLFFSREM